MEENTNSETNQQKETETEKAGCCLFSSSNWKKYLCSGAAAFIGGFLAVYFIADQALYRHYKNTAYINAPYEFRRAAKDFEKMYKNERKMFEREFGRFDSAFNDDSGRKNPFKHSDKTFSNEFAPFALNEMTMESIKINTEIDKDEYTVIIDLTPFQGDENRINYNVSGRKLTVFGNSKIKEDKIEQNLSFSQDFLLPNNAVISKIKKEKDKNRLKIEVPLK